ncbi:hypothetical protein BKA66DRAFT_432877 [Pyrenochaeta sp. MPI-SDFR-AT-0127]|nr:hypothetical protein BKA66DRAFT_432877 [Pyrenochaeta sp. MPI-SDFR-AT-0127]
MSDSDNTVGSNVGLPNAPDSTAPVLSDNKRVTDDLAPPARPTTSPSGFLDRTYLKTNGMYFQKTSNAILAMDHAQWYSPTDDASIPQTDEDHQKVVKKITDAFKDMSIAKDNEGNAYRKRLTPGANEFYPDWAIEDCAWIIVDFAKHIHTSGFRAPIYDRVLVEQIGQTQSWTFAERMDWLCLKHEKVWTILGAPHKLFNSTMINNESNANRNRWVKDGRAMDTVHLQTARKRKYTSNDTSEDPMSTPSNSDGMSALVQRAKIPRKTRKSKLSTVGKFINILSCILSLK